MKYGFILKSDSMQTSAIFIASMNTPSKILLYQGLICLQCTKQQYQKITTFCTGSCTIKLNIIYLYII